MKALKKILLAVGVAILAIVLLALGFFWKDSVSDKYDVTIDDSKIPLFEEIPLGFEHQYNGKKSLIMLMKSFSEEG